ncbi:unnamed protein product, partial [Laminaria digitata]
MDENCGCTSHVKALDLSAMLMIPKLPELPLPRYMASCKRKAEEQAKAEMTKMAEALAERRRKPEARSKEAGRARTDERRRGGAIAGKAREDAR